MVPAGTASVESLEGQLRTAQAVPVAVAREEWRELVPLPRYH